MPRQQLSGTLEEQLATVYELVRERMATGRYSGAVHYAKEIIKVDPNYRDIQEILKQAEKAKREQRFLLVISLIGAIVAVAITRGLGWTQDWQSLMFALAGLVIGFLIGNTLYRRSPS
ncbi:MAG: hypothetical protein D6775_06035 [Caldilineae bacterium]|nr:MAG: hypothetical protein D6775_06035 [Caldilineae bacterium]